MTSITTQFISHLAKRLFGDRPVQPIVQTVLDEEIPRYPPFMKGLPAAPVDRILTSQAELIQAIEQALALPSNLYQTIAAPVIARYAAFSHLLPASESHHHRGAGGLFRHGLEVAHWATLASQGCLFATDATPRTRKELELRWRLAVCFAGLLHDIGKPVSDMAVVDRDGKHIWNPCDENLNDWAAQNGIDRYFLRWRENRHKRHEQFSALVIERVLTRSSRSYILEQGPEIMQAMLEAINGLDRGAKLYELVISADCRSVERDLKSHYHSVDSAMGMPIEKYLFDAMRRLIKSGQWLANEKGARLWRFKEGLHIVWRTGAQDIVDILAKDKVPGIPRDEDTLADILIERGLAIPKSYADGRQYRYWRMQPQGLNNTLYMLRLASLELIFSNEPPVVIEGIEINDDDVASEVSTTETAKLSSQADKKKSSVPKVTNSIAKPTVIIPIEIQDSQLENAVNQVLLNPTSNQSNQEQLLISEANLAVEPPLPDSESSITAPSQRDQPPLNSAKLNEMPNTLQKLRKEVENGKAGEVLENPALTEKNTVSAQKWLSNQGVAGEWLIRIAQEINGGQWQVGLDLLETQNKWLLSFPGVAQKIGVDLNLFIKTLDDQGWIITDILSPMRKVQVIQEVRGVLLAAEPSAMLKLLLISTQPKSQTTVQKAKETAPKSTKPLKTNPTPKTNEKSGNQQAQKTLPTDQEGQSEFQNSDQPSKYTKITNGTGSTDGKNSAQKESSTPLPNAEQLYPKDHPDQLVSDRPIDFNTSSYSLAATAVIEQIRKSLPVTAQTSDEENWREIDNATISEYAKFYTNLKRSLLLREIHNHPDCRHVDGLLLLHIKP